MSYSYPEIKKFAGLYLQANSLTVPDGALEVADNMVVKSDDIASKVRGNYRYFQPSGHVLNKLFNYQDKLISVSNNRASYYANTGTAPNQTGSATNLTGETVSITGGRVSRSAQGNGNLYFTSDNGVMKIEAYNSEVFQAGTPPGLDLNASLLGLNGPIGGDTQVGYRVVFGRRDANDNLILGAPSDTFILVSAPTVGVSYTSVGAGPYTVTVTSPNHNLATGMSITVTGATDADADGIQIITVTGANTFTYSTISDPTSGTLNWSTSRVSRLEFSVPSEINDVNDSYFYQIYRTTQSLNSTVTPSPDFKLVVENMLTALEIANNIAFFDDEIDDILLGAELYTNPNSREGELQANFKPPKCEDLVLYKDHLLYMNCTTRHTLNLDVADTSALAANDYVIFKVGVTERRYVFKSGVANRIVKAETAAGTTTITITYTAHGFSNGWTVFISDVTGTVPEGLYTVSGVTANTFDITSTGNSATALSFQGVTDGTFFISGFDNSSISVSVQLRTTAQLLVKAVNRDDASLVYGQYISGIDDIPGKMRFSSKGFGDPIFVRANTDAAGAAFNPTLPSSFVAGNQIYSRNDSQPHIFYSSKTGELEAVPVVNFFPVGSRNKAIKRAFALRDSVIILKEDGVFRLTGDDPSNFSITAIDTTVFIAASSSADVLNNQVFCLSNQGVCAITESSVQIVSRTIDDVIQPILGSASLEVSTGAIAYESERLYIITTIRPNETSPSVTYLYNVLNNTWTTWEFLIDEAVVGPSDTLFFINSINNVQKERKTQSKLDFSGQNHSVTVNSVSLDKRTAVLTISTVTPEVGDVLLKADLFSRIRTVSGSVSPFTVTFANPTNLIATDSVQLYEKYDATMKFAPFHAGQVGLMKQFAQLQIHLREESVSRLEISFSGYTFGGSEVVDWQAANILGSAGNQQGWGFQPWGFFPWGNTDAINLVAGTRPAPVIRIYVPRFQQRNTFIQAVLEHREAGEQMNLQSLCWAVRPYQERVSK